MGYNYAVENVGRDVLIIRNNQVIGKGMSQTMRGDRTSSPSP